jgi:hypothetical protein
MPPITDLNQLLTAHSFFRTPEQGLKHLEALQLQAAMIASKATAALDDRERLQARAHELKLQYIDNDGNGAVFSFIASSFLALLFYFFVCRSPVSHGLHIVSYTGDCAPYAVLCALRLANHQHFNQFFRSMSEFDAMMEVS